MQPSRPPNRPDGSTAVTTGEESGGKPSLVGAAGASAPTSRSNDSGERSFGQPGSTGGGGQPGSPPRCRTKAVSPRDNLDVFQKRSIFIFPRRSSSGYFSFEGDSLPSSPLSPRPATADRATQTPSPTGQVMKHAVQRMAEPHSGGPGTQSPYDSSPSPFSTRQQRNAVGMQAEAVGQELRRIGDDFNRLLLLRGLAGGHRHHVVIDPNQLPHLHQEPAVLLFLGLLLLVIGRIVYLQGSTNSQDHSQV